jgi:hypothetical protein
MQFLQRESCMSEQALIYTATTSTIDILISVNLGNHLYFEGAEHSLKSGHVLLPSQRKGMCSSNPFSKPEANGTVKPFVL